VLCQAHTQSKLKTQASNGAEEALTVVFVGQKESVIEKEFGNESARKDKGFVCFVNVKAVCLVE